MKTTEPNLSTHQRPPNARRAEIVREYGPFPQAEAIHGVTFDGRHVWLAQGTQLAALDPESGEVVRELPASADAGTAFDGQHLWQLADGSIRKLDPSSGRILAELPAPVPGCCSGLAWAEGSLWVGDYPGRKIHQVDPRTGAIVKTIESDRFVTGVSWVDGELWHGTMEEQRSDIRRVDADTGAVLECLEMPPGLAVSGLEADRGDLFYCGGGQSGKVRAVRRPKTRKQV